MKCPPWLNVNEDLGLDFPLEDLQGSDVLGNGQVLCHISYFLQEGQGEWSIADSMKLMVETVKQCWFGANVKMACNKMLLYRTLALNKFMRYINRGYSYC